MNSYDTKTWAWEAQINALKSELEVQAAENTKLRAALRSFVDGYDRDCPFRQADMHKSDCNCMRCIRDIAEMVLKDNATPAQEVKHD